MLTKRQRKIVAALRDGFGHDVTRVERTDLVASVFVAGVDEPIRVERRDVIIPDALSGAAPGIRLDVQTINAGF